MNEVRLIILVVGVLVMGGIYLHWRFLERREDDHEDAPRGWVDDRLETPQWEDPLADEEMADPRWREPSLDDSMLDELEAEDHLDVPLLQDVAAPGRSDSAQASSRETAEAGGKHILILHVVARSGRYFNGSDIADELDGMGFGFGQGDIFHFFDEPDEDGEPVVLFSAANMLEPGTFDEERLGEIYTPGVTLFSVLPGQRPGPVILGEMVDTATEMARRLGGEVLDASHELLTSETIADLEEQLNKL